MKGKNSDRRWTFAKTAGTVVLMPFLITAGAVMHAADAGEEGAQDSRSATKLETLIYGVLKSAASGQDAQSTVVGAAKNVADQGVDYWFPGIGSSLPAWTKRFEFEWDVREDVKPDFSVLTVQPLYQSDGDVDTFFTQGRVALNHQFGERRLTTNIGLGYRRLFLHNSALAGINTFYDREWDEELERFSIGGELRWSGFDLFANSYWDVSGSQNVSNGFTEEPLDGRDVELTAQVPYLPWARVRTKRFYWDGEDGATDVDGWAISGEFDLTQNIQIEAGWVDENISEEEAFAQLRFTLASWGDYDKPVALSNRFVDSAAYRVKPMKERTLDKVRRSNEIVTQRAGNGVVITRTD